MTAIFYENKVQNGTVKVIFEHLDSLVYAIDEIKRSGLAHELIVTTPLPRHDVEHVIYKNQGPSPVRWFTLFGALFGVFPLHPENQRTGFQLNFKFNY